MWSRKEPAQHEAKAESNTEGDSSFCHESPRPARGARPGKEVGVHDLYAQPWFVKLCWMVWHFINRGMLSLNLPLSLSRRLYLAGRKPLRIAISRLMRCLYSFYIMSHVES